ncbi:MAG: hypothetical protein H0A75_08955 [Candidatus Methanofishera endochildressiae]|uniref:Uncharacterized protein n=1 Tax=Candidatus Methanofishera endochildressiae TaxID=2738884 RepID=A0A7Z0MQF7_9GAMM|nr:hypothetical protein [Candidatus Methanofishera endochildressiae]
MVNRARLECADRGPIKWRNVYRARRECGRSWVHRCRNGYRASLLECAVDRGFIGVVMVGRARPGVRQIVGSPVS